MVPSDAAPLNALNWAWIAAGAVLPPILALLAAFPFWRSGQMTLGSIAGAAVIFAAGVGLILREYVEMDRVVRQCFDAGLVCWPEPSPFTRCAIYAFIALIQVFALFSLSLIVEERVRRRDYSPEWR